MYAWRGEEFAPWPVQVCNPCVTNLLLHIDVNRQRAAGADARVGVAQAGNVGFAIAVEVAHEQAGLVVDAEIEREFCPAGVVQPLRTAWHDQHGVVLSLANHKIERAVAIPIRRRNGVAKKRMLVLLFSRRIGKIERGARDERKGSCGLARVVEHAE